MSYAILGHEAEKLLGEVGMRAGASICPKSFSKTVQDLKAVLL